MLDTIQMNLVSVFHQHEEPLSAQAWLPSAFVGWAVAAVAVGDNNVL